MQIRRHQFMGEQVVKVFAARDDEVSFTTFLFSMWNYTVNVIIGMIQYGSDKTTEDTSIIIYI